MRDYDIPIRQWMWRYYDAKRDVVRLEHEYDEIVSIQESAGAISYNGIPTMGNASSDLSGMIIARDDATCRLLRAKQKQAKCYAEIIDAISKLDYSVERDIISMRYTWFSDGGRKTEWEEIAKQLGFSPSHIKHVHGIAIQKLIHIVGPETLEELSTKKH